MTVDRRNGVDIPAEATDYIYDLLGNLDQVRLPNGVVSDYDYDELNRLELLREFNDTNQNHLYDAGVDTLLAEYDYDLAADGKRTGVTEKTLVDAVLQETRIDWLYDNLGRLTRESYNSADDSLDFITDYTFDLVGNRLTKQTDTDPTFSGDPTFDETVTYTYDPNDRLLTETKDAPGTADDRFTVYEHGEDNRGTQQTKKTVHEGLSDVGDVVEETTYGYNLQGRMADVEVDSDGNGTIDHTSQYEYTDDGTRISQTVDGTKTLYLVDSQNPTGYSQVLEEKDAAGNVTKTYTLGLDIISQQAPSSGLLYLLKDGHGSTRGLVDAVGLPLSNQIYAYDAFGNAIGFDPANALTSRLYNSEPFDLITGFNYFRARYYDPRLGRFNRLDPFFGNLYDPLTLHKHLFCHGDGINFNDPTGQWSVGQTVVALSIASVVANLAITQITSIRFGNHFAGQLKILPDGVLLTASVGAAVRGITGGGSLSLYFDIRDLRIYYFGTYEAGIAPLSAWPKHTDLFATGFGLGLVFNTESPSDLGGDAWNAYWPLGVMSGPGQSSFLQRIKNRAGWEVTGNWNRIYSYMTTLGRYVNQAGGTKTWYKLADKPGTLVLSTSAELSLTKGAVALSWQWRDINFGTTWSRSTQPRDLIADLRQLPKFVQDSASKLQSKISQIKAAASEPALLSRAMVEVMDVLKTSGS